jgi:hypothetical protein
MKNKILLIGAIVFVALPMSVWAADIVGNWIVREPSPEPAETVFSFKVDGSKLTGTNPEPLSCTQIDCQDASYTEVASNRPWKANHGIILMPQRYCFS